ncbi:MAG: HU family DNA-binding protein [Pseudorhodobacter sp.]|nr:HU family DNA-binding protein [Pseudorhodobacter sp.]
MTTPNTPPTKPAAHKPAAKPKLVKVPAPEAGAVAAAKPVAGKPRDALKLRELVDAVVKATNGKKKDVKAIVEATLTSLGAALSHGKDLNLPPLGKAKVGRQQDQASGGELIVVKLHRGGAKGAGQGAGKKAKKEALAEPDE